MTETRTITMTREQWRRTEAWAEAQRVSDLREKDRLDEEGELIAATLCEDDAADALDILTAIRRAA
ncbi:hypothetical protein [Roseomonas indoligenes]|uniref:Uncharacterized protein n=1 Tax=Roseomonas indoligenes TaxID=2820811 RepID=A0A940MXC1_9PROT|nr:hypothetical protein [Pararoseomonas indoligenes]MBP0492211.1 hypothetical protein [Pararoseomonas indoligenes]